jgi:hypothetical protein
MPWKYKYLIFIKIRSSTYSIAYLYVLNLKRYKSIKYLIMSQRIPKMIAIGKVAADGKILRATPGISVKPKITPGNIYGPGEDVGYTVELPKRLVCDNNYIIMLTAENFGEDGPDFTITSIAHRYQTKRGFEVIIWGDRSQGGVGYGFPAPVQSNWSFVIYDLL